MQVYLTGSRVRLEPISRRHIAGLIAAAAVDPKLYDWTVVPQGEAMVAYVERAMSWRERGFALPFVTVRQSDDAVVGSTRFFDLHRWEWPKGHYRFGSAFPDTCEIGYTWLSGDAVGTGVNTEAKLLMLAHAFETWGVASVCFHTDARNERSRAALLKIGATFEGILRAHRLASDYTPRNSARYSIVASEWPGVRERLS